MRRRIVTALIALAASAAVNTVTEPTAGSTVYIAGNPDLYPIEYYDSKTESYQGMLPDLYAEISETTGIEFTYVHGGIRNEQDRLAKNRQVEIISAHIRDEVDDLSDEVSLLTYEKDGKTTEICVGFTEIADESMTALVKEQISAIPDSRLLALALQVSERPRRSPYLWWFVGGILLLTAAVITLTVLLVRLRIQEKKRLQNKYIDSLTGIGNTEYFRQNYEHYISSASCSLYYIAYIALDIQRMEAYLGAAEAVEFQKHAANILSSSATDTEFSARIHDGVFLYALQSPSEEEAGVRITELLNRLNSYDKAVLEEYHILYRCGIFHLNAANLPFETAMMNSRQGYNYAAQNKLPFAFADAKMLNREAKKAKLQRKFSDAVKNNEFKLYLQFIVNSRNRQIIGAEALSRWQNPESGLLSPADYIEAMSTAGIIHHLDFYIFEEACRQLEAWSASEKNYFWLSCNFTRSTFSRDDFMKRFEEIVNQYSFERSRLVIELTEDSLADNQAVAYQNMLRCKKMGFLIALDDLGSGYSSFSDLCDYPIDLIKIDRHIVSKSTTDRGNALVCGLTKLAHDLGIKVLCEGVETEAENSRILNAGCDYIQGYYYSRVLPKEEADNFCTKYYRLLMAAEEQARSGS